MARRRVFLVLAVLLSAGLAGSCGRQAGARAADAPGGPVAGPGEDVAFVKVPNPLSGENPTYPVKPQAVPEPGKPFKDAQFQTTLTRVTRAKGLRHEYARFDPFNRALEPVRLVQVGQIHDQHGHDQPGGDNGPAGSDATGGRSLARFGWRLFGLTQRDVRAGRLDQHHRRARRSHVRRSQTLGQDRLIPGNSLEAGPSIIRYHYMTRFVERRIIEQPQPVNGATE